MDRSTYLNRFTADHITRLCELNHIDINFVKTKQERVACLCDLSYFMEEEPPVQKSVETLDFLKIIQELEISRRQDTEKLCHTLAVQLVSLSKPRQSSTWDPSSLISIN